MSPIGSNQAQLEAKSDIQSPDGLYLEVTFVSIVSDTQGCQVSLKVVQIFPKFDKTRTDPDRFLYIWDLPNQNPEFLSDQTSVKSVKI